MKIYSNVVSIQMSVAIINLICNYWSKGKGVSVAHWQHTGFWYQGTMLQISVGENIFPSYDVMIAVYLLIYS